MLRASRPRDGAKALDEQLIDLVAEHGEPDANATRLTARYRLDDVDRVFGRRLRWERRLVRIDDAFHERRPIDLRERLTKRRLELVRLRDVKPLA